MDKLTWFVVLFVHHGNCPAATCPNAPVVIAMPSQEACVQVRDLNSDKAIECWAKPPK